MSQQRPCGSDKQAALAAVLASDAFARSERLRAFLTYVVEKEMAGEAQQLKGYTIAIDVFGRSQSFNADSDPLVRVHAGKLRKLLAQYYETDGVGDPWQIAIPKGGYTPIFRPSATLTPAAPTVALPEARAEDEHPAVAAPIARASGSHEIASGEADLLLATPRSALPVAPPALQPDETLETVGPAHASPAPPSLAAKSRPSPKPSPFAALSILPLLMLLPLSSTAMSVHVPTAALMQSSLVDAVAGDLPHLHLKLEGAVSARAREFSSLLSAAFAQYRTINSTTLPTIEDSTPANSDEKLSFDVAIRDQQEPGGLQVTITSSANGEIVSTSFIPHQEIADENDMLFESLQLASASLTADGAIFRYAANKGIETQLMRCMRLTDVFRLSRDRESFRQMRDCQQGLIPGPDGKMIFAVSAGALPKAVSEVK